jgi:hypothetical protein
LTIAFGTDSHPLYNDQYSGSHALVQHFGRPQDQASSEDSTIAYGVTDKPPARRPLKTHEPAAEKRRLLFKSLLLKRCIQFAIRARGRKQIKRCATLT